MSICGLSYRGIPETVVKKQPKGDPMSICSLSHRGIPKNACEWIYDYCKAELGTDSAQGLAEARTQFEAPWNRWNRFRTMAAIVSVVALMILQLLLG